MKMKLIDYYKNNGILTEKANFDYLMSNLKETISTYDFFVAWDKVLANVAKVEISLNILNSLIGKENIKSQLRALIKRYPEIVSAIPILIAVREKIIRISDIGKDITYSFKLQMSYSDDEISKIIEFADLCGLIKVLEDKSIKNLVDYYLGVEVGLDTNARKNRSGKAMEKLTEIYIKRICDLNGFNYMPQATATEIRAMYNIDVPVDKTNRNFDFAVFTNNKLYLLEVNYYSGGGSKLKSVAGEFISLSKLISSQSDIGFIWITDGKGWETARRPLSEAFNSIDFVMNLKMLDDGLLNEILTKGL